MSETKVFIYVGDNLVREKGTMKEPEYAHGNPHYDSAAEAYRKYIDSLPRYTFISNSGRKPRVGEEVMGIAGYQNEPAAGWVDCSKEVYDRTPPDIRRIVVRSVSQPEKEVDYYNKPEGCTCGDGKYTGVNLMCKIHGDGKTRSYLTALKTQSQPEKEIDNVRGTFTFDHDKKEERYEENPNFGKPKPQPEKEQVEGEGNMELFKKIWRYRNPMHENNYHTHEDMFWESAEKCAREYCQQLAASQPRVKASEVSGGRWVNGENLQKVIDNMKEKGFYPEIILEEIDKHLKDPTLLNKLFSVKKSDESLSGQSDEAVDWDDVFTNAPVRLHPKTEEYLRKLKLFKPGQSDEGKKENERVLKLLEKHYETITLLMCPKGLTEEQLTEIINNSWRQFKSENNL